MCLLQILSLRLKLAFSLSWHCFSQNTGFYLTKSNLSIIPFIAHAFGVTSKVIAKPKIIHRFFPMLSFGSFIVLCFTFMFRIHSELVCKRFKVCVYIHFFAYGFQVVEKHYFRTICWKDYRIAFALFSRITWLYLCKFTSGLSFLFHWWTCLIS